MGSPVLELKDRRHQGRRAVLDAYTLTIEEGEHTAIVGQRRQVLLVKLLTHGVRALVRQWPIDSASVRQRQLGRVRSAIPARHRVGGSASAVRRRQQRNRISGGRGALRLSGVGRHPALRGDRRDAKRRPSRSSAWARSAGPPMARRAIERRARQVLPRARWSRRRGRWSWSRRPVSIWPRGTISWSAFARSPATARR